MDVSSEDTTSAAERHVRDIPIHGGVNNWYIDVLEPPRSYRIDIGYVSRRGKFYVLARSNVVTTPKAGVTDALDENWTNVQKQFERIQNPSSNGNGSSHHAHADRPPRSVRGTAAPADEQRDPSKPGDRRHWLPWDATSTSRSMPS